MEGKLYKILLILGIAAVLVAVPAFWFTLSAENYLEVSFLDVGQGDSILIKAPKGQNILIDGGPNNTVIKRLSEEISWWDKNIDLMILTHPHDDHVSGLVDVIKRYKVKKILYTGVTHNSPNYLAWLELVRDMEIPMVIADRLQVINFGDDCKLEIFYPRENLAGKSVKNLNNSSIVARLVYGESKFLFMGDAEIEVEEELIEADVDLKSNILKAGHHGSDTSTGIEFLEKVNQKISVISVGADNNFGHPSRRVIKRFERADTEIFRTDLSGTTRFVGDGKKIWSTE